MAQPDADGGKFDEGQVVGCVFLVSCGNGAEALELVEEAFNPVSVAVEKGTEGRRLGPMRHRADVGPYPSCGHRLA